MYGAPGSYKSQSINNHETCPLVSLGTIAPVPSAQLSVSSQQGGVIFPITLDSGATVSFISLQTINSLKAIIQPNGQLAQLAIPSVRAKSLGEIDILVTETTLGNVCLRLRALVMPTLSVPCYGGRTFHRDNHIVDCASTSTVTLHGGRFTIKMSHISPPPQPPPSMTVDPKLANAVTAEPPEPGTTQAQAASQSPPAPPRQLETTVLVKEKTSILPEGVHPIPLQRQNSAKVLVLPPSPLRSSAGLSVWPPQVCDVALGSALYVNTTDGPLVHEKHIHFRIIPMTEELVSKPESTAVDHLALSSVQARQPVPDDILSQISVNSSILSPQQITALNDLHRRHITAFNEDMSGGFYDAENPYQATFSFRDENRAPPYKVWAPQYSRQCQDLMQAKCDDLEREGILVDPSKYSGVDVRLVHPSFIQQKGRAKHKPLNQCSLDEVRYITCFNALNDSIHPIPGRSSAYNDIVKFAANHNFFIFADLTSSYFQVKVDKKFWKYMGIMTPYRGMRVMTRLGQGLLNSDVHLEQVVTRVLGDSMLRGECIIARDDLIVGASTIEECLSNWAEILAQLDKHNLKLNPSKVRILPKEAEIYGHKLQQGKISPSDHIVSSLLATTIDSLTTVKQVNSWKGLYKTLIRHLPDLASLMVPFDTACAGQPSGDRFDWSRPGILAAFNAATKHLGRVTETYLPHPSEQLVLKPDTSQSDLCTGWVMYTGRVSSEGTTWLPVQFASAKLPNYMETWSPCELEGVGAVLAIDQTRHWINESLKPTLVMPDNKPVVEATGLMKMGKHSRNPRLQSLLASVNRSNVVFCHNSAKAGLHIVPDTLSRLPPKKCTSKDCQVERFLSDLPARVECMPISLQSLALESSNPANLAATGGEMTELLGRGSGPIPLGARESWIALQADCEDCAKFLLCKRLGQVPGRKDRNKAVVNKMLKICEVSNGLIVSKTFDTTLMKEASRVFVPSTFLQAILTVMHVRLSHPLPSQLQRIFEKYFVAFNVQNLCKAISEECSLCVACQRFPKELDTFSPSPGPEHPGSHMNLDILRRASQIIAVNCDRFSNFVTASIISSESREDLIQAVLTTVTPIRHSARVEVRTDRATALKSLADRPDQQLVDNGIHIVLGDHGNKNSNCSVDKEMRMLEEELRKLVPEGTKVTPGQLAMAVTNLNDRIRGHGLSSSQLHFSRDQHTGKNLALKDKTFQEVREARRERQPAAKPGDTRGPKPHKPATIKPGQVVFIRSEGNKHTSRDPLLVTSVEGKTVTGHRMLRMTPAHQGLPKITSRKLHVDEKFLAPSKSNKTLSCQNSGRLGSDSADWRGEMRPASKPPPWHPLGPLVEDEFFEEPATTPDDADHHDQPVQLQPDPPQDVYRPPHRRRREQWVVRGQADADEPPEQPAQVLQQVIDLQEEERAQAAHPDITRTGRVRKRPDRYGIEEERGPDDCQDKVLVISEPPSREITPQSSPNPSPDSSMTENQHPWLPTADVHPGRSARERAQNILERHRHWSATEGRGIPTHPRFDDWKPKKPPDPPGGEEGL